MPIFNCERVNNGIVSTNTSKNMEILQFESFEEEGKHLLAVHEQFEEKIDVAFGKLWTIQAAVVEA